MRETFICVKNVYCYDVSLLNRQYVEYPPKALWLYDSHVNTVTSVQSIWSNMLCKEESIYVMLYC